jgi:hypothetical protein
MKIKVRFEIPIVVEEDKETFNKLFPHIPLGVVHADAQPFYKIPSNSDFDLEVKDSDALEVIHYYLKNWFCEYKHDPELNMKVLSFY